MATTHVVSLFLPYTTHFHDKDEEPEPPRSRSGHPPIHARRSVDLTKRGSTTSLLADAQEIERASEALFDEFADELEQQLPITPGNPRALMRTDAYASDWGKQAIFNQPQSRAGPLPSASILDFAQVFEEQERRGDMRADRTALSQITSRAQSSDRTFESKTWTIETALQGNGGLTNALRESTSEDLADITWHGTLGFPTDSVPQDIREEIADHLGNEYQAQVVYMSDKNFQGHYHGYCKTILWPILHYQVPDHPKSRAYADHSWKFYTAVNQAFADRVIEHYKRGDTIWVHDYHLLLVPRMIREKLPAAQIGFFLHTAFPSSEVFRCLWWRRELLEGMLGADLVTFQIEEYAEHFLQTCSRVLTVETTSKGVQLDDHFVNVISQPIGINLAAIDEQRESLEVHEWVHKIQKRYHDKRIIVARDKLDSISGVRHKLLSYELFLNKHPEWRGRVVFIQVATSSEPEQSAIIGDIVTRIEACHSTLAHQPLVFLRQDIPFSQYLALLSVADVLMVSSLREGMNLAAHDYVVCQDGQFCEKKHGSLILSEFTGSAAVFGDSQLPINPWDNHMQVEAIKKALEMPDEEKRIRWQKLHDIVVKRSGAAWAKSLSHALRQVYREHSAHDTVSIPRLALNQVSTVYKTAKSRVFILDYEGTLAPHRTQTGITLGSPERVIDALNELIADPRNLVYIMSGRMPDELKQHFKTVPRLGLIAENGCFLREAGIEDAVWTSFPSMDEVKEWKGAVKNVLKYYLERLDGTYLEERHCSLILRFDHCEDKDAAVRMIGECADHINGSFIKMRVCAVPINQAILIETMDYSKASAAVQLLKKVGKPVDFMFVAGDDREDEGIFRWANKLDRDAVVEHVFTVSVGRRNTEAQTTLTQGTSGLLMVLKKLAKLSADAQPVDYFNVKDRARRESSSRQLPDR